MKNTAKLLGMTAAIALLSAPAMAHKSKKYDLDNDGRAEATIKYSTSESAFQKMDVNHDNLVSMKEFTKTTIHDNEPAVFKMYDLDNDGYVTRAELRNNSKYGGSWESSKSTSNLKTKDGRGVGSMDKKYFSSNTAVNVDNPFYNDPEIANDTNINIDNPFVDDPELKNDVNWGLERRIDPNKPLFPQMDRNGDGYLSRAEFEAATMYDNEAEVFAMLDNNDSGTISQYEFKTYSKAAVQQ
jgi:Ca2+-binding EF-hand superfamily protein